MMRLPSFSIKFLTVSSIVMGLLTWTPLGVAGQRGGGHAGGGPVSFGASYASYGYSAQGYGGYGYNGSSYNYSTPSSTYSYLPSGWWTGSNSSGDPRGVGYNPDAGYAWDTVTTLVLETFPAKARVTLDGIFVGTMDLLGPFQLPMGQHTLRIDAPGYEPSETVLKVEKPVVQQLTVRLSAVKHVAKAGPKKAS